MKINYGFIRGQRLTNARNGARLQGYQGEGVTNINTKKLIGLLDNTRSQRGPLGRQATDLLKRMETNPWHVRAGLHQGGIGGAGRPADPRTHITLQVDRTTHHLRFDSKASRLIEIT